MITDLTFPYLLRKPAETTENPPFLLLLHGFGSNEADLFSFADALPRQSYVAAARAPLNLFPGGFAWYSIDFTRGIKFTDAKQANESVQQLYRFITELKGRYNITTDRFYMGGFSQGAIMSYGVAINYPQELRGILAMSGYVLKDYLPEKIDKTALQRLQVLATHGTMDEVIPVRMGQMGREFMEELGVTVHYKEYPIGHGISPAALDDIIFWFGKALSE